MKTSQFVLPKIITWRNSHRPKLCLVVKATAPEPNQSLRYLHTDILIIDATNVLCRAAMDAKRDASAASQRQLFTAWLAFLLHSTQPSLSIAVFDQYKGGPRWRETTDPDYLRRRKRRKDQKITQSNSSNSSEPPPNTHPFASVAAEQGCLSLVATEGNEADDVIAAVCAQLEQGQQHVSIEAAAEGQGPMILIASGDADMQRNISSQVSWLKLLSLATQTCPAGIEMITASDFQQQQGLPPHLYGEWLATIGKKEAGVGGIGISPSTAARLLTTYKTLDAVVHAAAQGKLKGWRPAVVNALTSPASLDKLQRNRQLLAHPVNLSVLLERDVQAINAGLSQLRARHEIKSDNLGEESFSDAVSDIAWKHPLHARRWEEQQEVIHRFASQLAATVGEQNQVAVQAATPGGLPVDILMQDTAVFVCGMGQFDAKAWQQLDQNHQEEESERRDVVQGVLDGTAAKGSKALLRFLHPAMQHHIGLVKKSGLKPVIILSTSI